MNKIKLIIVEGPQGTGKTTLANYLRENIGGSNLYRMSGQKDKKESRKQYSIIMYDALANYLRAMQKVPMDMIFDRTFFTEEVYARLGLKEYSFTDEYKHYLRRLAKLDYDIYYFSLYLEDTNLFKKRLDRGAHHNYQSFSLENSVNQQKVYRDIAKEVNRFKNIKVIELPMDEFKESYKKVDSILGINNE